MNKVTEAPPKQPFGVFSMVSESFSLLYGKFPIVLAMSFAVSLMAFFINGLLFGFAVAAGLSEAGSSGSTASSLQPMLMPLIEVLAWVLATTLVIQLAYSAKLDQRHMFFNYFRLVLPAIFPLMLMGTLGGILWFFSISFLVVVVGSLGGNGLVLFSILATLLIVLWCSVVFYVTIPIVVIEKVDFSALGRSAVLTKEYRWQIFVLMALVLFIGLVFMVGLMLFIAVLTRVMDPGILYTTIVGTITSLAAGFTYAFGGIIMTLTYIRLREIKETIPADQLAEVFK